MIRLIPILLAVAVLFSGCGAEQSRGFDIYAMNTFITLNAFGGDEELYNRAHDEIDRLELLFSATRQDSELNSGEIHSPELLELITLALEVAQNTEGAYDPTCRALTELWNISGGGYLPREEEIALALEAVGYSRVSVEEGALASPENIDLGGIAKGYALEYTLELLKKESDYGTVSFGGNVGVYGSKPDGSLWRIAIRDPFDTSGVMGYMEIDGGYVSVSGDYERYFEREGVRYHHIFDPKTGYPCRNGVHSVAVYTHSAALGDALSTALFVMGAEGGMEFYESGIYDFEALFVTDQGIVMTRGMEEIFVNEN